MRNRRDKKMKYKYIGTEPVTLTTLGITVSPGDIIEGDDVINNPLFEDITEVKQSNKEKIVKGGD